MPKSIQSKYPITLMITTEDHRNSKTKKKPQTVCKLTTLTHEHFKSAIFDPFLNNFDCTLRSILTEFGFVPPLWCAITDIYIHRQYRKIRIDDMILIQIIHPDSNK